MVHDPGTLKLVPVEIGELGKLRGAGRMRTLLTAKPILLGPLGADVGRASGTSCQACRKW